MKPTAQQLEDFLNLKSLPGVSYELNATVTIGIGEHAGSLGSVISVEELGPDPIYLVELHSGSDTVVAQSRLCRAPPES